MRNILLKLKESPVLKSIGSVFLHTAVGLSPILIWWLYAVFFPSYNWSFEETLKNGSILIFCLTLVFTSIVDFRMFNRGKVNLFPIVYCLFVIVVYLLIVLGTLNEETINIFPILIVTLASLGLALIISSITSVPKFSKLAQYAQERQIELNLRQHLDETIENIIEDAQKNSKNIGNPGV